MLEGGSSGGRSAPPRSRSWGGGRRAARGGAFGAPTSGIGGAPLPWMAPSRRCREREGPPCACACERQTFHTRIFIFTLEKPRHVFITSYSPHYLLFLVHIASRTKPFIF